MKFSLWVLLIQLTGMTVFAQQYAPVEQGSAIAFKIRNFGFGVEGSFKGLEGKIRFDPAHPEEAQFDVSVDAASVNTGNEMRDEHLRSADYFDVKIHPRIRFVAEKVSAGSKAGNFIISGKLTIRNTTKDISFPFVATPMGNDYIFSGGFSMNRKDYGIGGTSSISNALTVTLTVLARKQ